MNSSFHAGSLRNARLAVAPHIPELAPQLSQDSRSILNALQDSYAETGHDPELVTSENWNKAERYTIATFCINEQIEYLVEGEGTEARFRNFKPGRKDSASPFGAYIKGLRATQVDGAQYVENTFTNGYDATHTWLPEAAKRYRRLGRNMLAHRMSQSVKEHITIEGLFLKSALRSQAYTSMPSSPWNWCKS